MLRLLDLHDDLLAESFSHATPKELYNLLQASKPCCRHVQAAAKRRAERWYRPLPESRFFCSVHENALHKLHFVELLLRLECTTISGSRAHTVCMHPTSGQVFAWGSGVEMDEDNYPHLYPAVIAAEADADGVYYCCLAQLGLGELIGPPTLKAEPMAGLAGVVVREVAVSDHQTLIVGACGGVWSCGIRYGSWGSDGYEFGLESACGHEVYSELTVPRRIETFECETLDGEWFARVVRRTYHHVFICRIATGEDHSLLVCDAGLIYSFGEGGYGQLGHGDFESKRIPTAISTMHFMGLNTCSRGTGRRTYHDVYGDRACQVSASRAVSLAVTHNGTLCGWGIGGAALGLGPAHSSSWGLLGRVSVPTRVEFPDPVCIKQAVAANNRILAVTCNGSLYTCGYHPHRLGHGEDVHFYPGHPGRLPPNAYVPRLVSTFAGKRVHAVAAGHGHNVVLMESGEVFTFGDNSHLQLGLTTADGDAVSDFVCVPTAFKALEGLGVVEVAAGASHTIVRLANGELRTCGSNDHGQLGREPDPESLYSAAPGVVVLASNSSS